MNDLNRQSLLAELTAHINQRAVHYYPEFAGQAIDVRAGRLRRRQFSDLCEFRILAPTGARRMLAKIVLSPEELPAVRSANGVDSYFVASPDLLGAEFRALTALAGHLHENNDPRFFSVRVLDSVFDDRALLMEMAAAQPLTALLKSSSRLHGSSTMPALLSAVERAGACLQAFHTMPRGEQRQARGVTRDDFVAWIAAVERHASFDQSAHQVFRKFCQRITELALRILPEQLPIGPLHDDFAPRNVLVDEQGRVAIIDLLDEWYGCVWEDIGQFLMALSANKGQALSGGRLFSAPSAEQIREAFLFGYYGNAAVPRPAILLYEAQVTLTKWAAALHRLADLKGWRGTFKRQQLALSARWYAKRVEQCLSRAETASMAAPREFVSASRLVSGGTP